VCRTTPADQVKKRSEGLSILIVDLREAVGHGLTIRPIRTMMNHATTELFFDDLEVPASALVGEEGQGFRYLLDGLNAERILIAAECVGDGRWFIDRASAYAKERIVFQRPIGQNQGVQFPIARAHVNVEATRSHAHPGGGPVRSRRACGAEPTWRSCWPPTRRGEAANVAVQTYGGFGFAGGVRHRAEVQGNQALPGGARSRRISSLAYIGEHVLRTARSY
jgi:acyl-CoA dehydrogenase